MTMIPEATTIPGRVGQEHIRLTCRVCYTPDAPSTKAEAEAMGWTPPEYEPPPPGGRRLTHNYWDHLSVCPECQIEIKQRQKEHRPVKRKAINYFTAVFVVAVVATMFFLSTSANADPRPHPPQRPDDIGACCYGAQYAVVWVIERQDCEAAVNSPSDKPGLFVKGTFSGTEEDKPCNQVPGGD